MITNFDAFAVQKQIPSFSEVSSMNRATPFILMPGLQRSPCVKSWCCATMGRCACDVVGATTGACVEVSSGRSRSWLDATVAPSSNASLYYDP